MKLKLKISSKVNIHTHATNSDGDSSPDHVASWYKNNQYDFLVLSDHNHLTILDEAENKKNKWPLLVPGEEITIREINGSPAALHINGIGIKNLIKPGACANPTATKAQLEKKTAIFFGFQNCSPIEDNVNLIEKVHA